MSMVMPMIMAALLIYGSKRGGMALSFATTFALGGFASSVLAIGVNRVVMPIETLLAGDPTSIRAGLAGSFLSAAFPKESARLVTSILSMAVLGRFVGREVIVTCGMIGLGFAMFENLLYSLTATTSVEIVIARVIPLMSHGAVALIMSSFLAQAASPARMIHVWRVFLALAVPLLLHGLYGFASFLFEVTEFPVLPEEPSDADWKLLVPPVATMVLVTAVGLVELIWGGCMVYPLRRTISGRQ